MAGFQQVKVFRDLEFTGSSAHTGNIKGLPSYDSKVVFYDDFVGKTIDTTNDYTVDGTNSGTTSRTVPHCMTLTTGGLNLDDVEVAMGVEWYPKYNAVLEVRFSINDVDETAVNVGFSDAVKDVSEDKIAMTYSGTALTTNATNFVGFLHDAAAQVSNMYGVSVNAGSPGSVINSGSEPSDDKQYTVRVELRDNGTTVDALFYVNSQGKEIDPANDLIGIEADAVARTTPLCPYIAIINHDEADTNHIDVDYIKVWQDRQ